MRSSLRFIAIVFCLISTGVLGKSADNFYAKHTLTLIVGGDPGGAHDAYARLLAPHLRQHIPGKPPIVVRNMTGASGIVAANYIANVAPRDGSTIAALYPGNVVEPLLQKSDKAKYDPRHLTWIGNIASLHLVCFTWHTSPVKTVDDARRSQVIMGGQSVGSGSGVLPLLMNELLGTKFKIVTGYKTSGLRLALERGEIQGICGLAYSTLLATKPDWILQHKLNFLAQSGLTRLPDLPNIPLVSKLAPNKNDAQIFHLLDIRDALGRPYVAPPGIPADRAYTLRRAFAQTMHDPAYLTDAKHAHQVVDFDNYAKMEAVINAAYAMPKSVIRKVSDLTHH